MDVTLKYDILSIFTFEKSKMNSWPIESRVVRSRNGIDAQGQIADNKECLPFHPVKYESLDPTSYLKGILVERIRGTLELKQLKLPPDDLWWSEGERDNSEYTLLRN